MDSESAHVDLRMANAYVEMRSLIAGLKEQAATNEKRLNQHDTQLGLILGYGEHSVGYLGEQLRKALSWQVQFQEAQEEARKEQREAQAEARKEQREAQEKALREQRQTLEEQRQAQEKIRDRVWNFGLALILLVAGGFVSLYFKPSTTPLKQEQQFEQLAAQTREMLKRLEAIERLVKAPPEGQPWTGPR